MLMREMDDGEDEEDMHESVITNNVDAYDDLKVEDSCSERSNQLGRKPAKKQAQSPATNKSRREGESFDQLSEESSLV
ncbi:hypothetical protein F511_25709 [Dorcoceras hygrometricum]|uniref:Uncharacterized protein n=1 Tax=Dorcoceras hygrometricum TaxID=472368 RepID=A0A2Z7A8N6_9LAMI|nr:hypothetical protein F511_25709 [Dorcoceras hygrometricum]